MTDTELAAAVRPALRLAGVAIAALGQHGRLLARYSTDATTGRPAARVRLADGALTGKALDAVVYQLRKAYLGADGDGRGGVRAVALG